MTPLRAFEAVARHGSIRGAAAELSIDHSAVSRHIRNLEGALGTRLVQTERTGVRLTDSGERFQTYLAQAFDLLDAAVEEISPRARRELRIWCAPGLATCWLTRHLPELEQTMTDCDILLNPTLAVANLERGDADVEIHYGARSQSRVASEVLVHPPFFPVAAPAFLASRGPFASAAALVEERLLHESSRDQWRNWFEKTGLGIVPPLGGPRLSHADAAIEAAVQGHGIALANRILVREELASGRLAMALPLEIQLEPYVLTTAQSRWSDPVIARFRRWLANALAEHG
ncbi:LysR substrate-binding domain-containing protein [Rhizorhabdus wittichii]|uniref:LysR family transcriptional regulator n=1 Tax=Rhizorhabdus wittichii TaxID=160791 RepID=A0A975HFU8_9SPHN|nr:LysR substrate-binding domain-containing protein [Rhizorhabdus wittichii]QTH23926.1 LysR family transcriptional regulator [Rhizorhabdus wittichii]